MERERRPAFAPLSLEVVAREKSEVCQRLVLDAGSPKTSIVARRRLWCLTMRLCLRRSCVQSRYVR